MNSCMCCGQENTNTASAFCSPCIVECRVNDFILTNTSPGVQVTEYERKLIAVGISTGNSALCKQAMNLVTARLRELRIMDSYRRAHDLKIRRRFWTELGEICHQGKMLYNTGAQLKISFDLWQRIIYRGSDVSQESMSRSWDRWKKKMRDIGLVHMEDAEEDSGVGRLDAVVDTSVIGDLLEMILGDDLG